MKIIRIDLDVKTIELSLTPSRIIEIDGFDAKGNKHTWCLRITEKGKIAVV